MTSPSTTVPRAEERWSALQWGTLFVLCGALFLDALDVSMVGVALPSIGDDLHLSTNSLQWVVSGYILGYGGLLLLGGRAADLLGRRRVFLVALGVFAVASLLGGLVDSGSLLIATRFIKGLSAAFTAPAGLSIITTTFAEGPVRNRALTIYSSCGATGFSMGLVLSGFLTEAGWRWTMLLPAPVALIALIAGLKLIPRTPRENTKGRGYDLPGAVSGTASMLLLVFTVVSAQSAGWASARTLGSFAGVAVLLTAFVLTELRSAHPLIRLGVLRSSNQVRANLGAATFFGSYVAFQFLVTQYLQNVLGYSAMQTALAFLPAGSLVAILSTRMGPIVDRFGTPRVIAAGFLALVTGYALFLRIDLHPSYAAVILPSMLLLGAAFALAFPSLNIQATNGVKDEEQGMVSGLLNTSFQVGGAIFLAVVTAVVTAHTSGPGGGKQAVLDSYRPALWVVTGIGVAGLLLTLSGLRRRRPSYGILVASSAEDEARRAARGDGEVAAASSSASSSSASSSSASSSGSGSGSRGRGAGRD
ncbi:MFS transporter [Streptomyces cocklensis]|jgi:MFS family permease|uniref:Major Facilitator Superfamily protein n=1 Tax=Actinacidiphila cocklensis TaxID=887465 RepID=A0A9W4GRE3_9ACTN|nr:MFS transporter [Actinacidiphila cocklensis]MDD1063904.1 MFS transporter [Actinacidiphila cocklensis]WSX73173.1 MFS transporter [Streptomyces sp. NBC_00899]WSX80761.1 MFS transporter [Streptomyces sp. NBC_00899]CAG6392531.1 Major Facilitator Superfamily protein [Actinacidiphila cocklensis]